MAAIFWDTNLFVYLIEKHPDLGGPVRALRQRMLVRGDQLMTSALTVGEILVRPVGAGDAQLANRYRRVFGSPVIRIVPFDLAASEHYARIRQDRSIRPADAIQLACAAASKVDLFITNDRRLSLKVVSGIQFITSLAQASI